MKIIEETIETEKQTYDEKKEYDSKKTSYLFSQRAIKFAKDKLKEFSYDKREVGEYVGSKVINECTVLHYFEVKMPQYDKWVWYVIETYRQEKRKINYGINEFGMLASKDAVLAPKWVPWVRKVGAKNQFSPSDVLPYDNDDPRLTKNPAYGDKPRVLSELGAKEAAKRWYDGNSGPFTSASKISQQACKTCGFFVPIENKFGGVFGVCANAVAHDDGMVVSNDHGCGAHSETDTNVDLKSH